MAEATAIVTQVRVAARHSLQFASWQQEISELVALQPGFLSQDIPPPSTANGVTDWVITQHFASREATQAWLRSDARMQAIAKVQPLLVGQDEVWVLGEGKVAPPPPHASAVIATSIRPGQETAFRTWHRKVVAAQSQWPGYRGARVEPPAAGLHDDWVTVVRFDTREHLDAWLTSDVRAALRTEAKDVILSSSARPVAHGFDFWFTEAGPERTARWKQNMVVLLVLYPIVFLFGRFVQTPFISGPRVPFPLALFIGNVFSVACTGYFAIAWASRALSWWLQPPPDKESSYTAIGLAFVCGLYALSITLFIWL
jgi:uncharacterized protein